MIEHVTNDFRRIKRLAPDWNLSIIPEVFYLVIKERNEDVGIMVFHPCDEDGMQMHVILKPDCKKRSDAYRDAFDWMFANTEHTIIRGRIPMKNRIARYMARCVGGRFDEIDIDGLRCYSIEKGAV